MSNIDNSLAPWLRHVIDELNLHHRVGWGLVLGVTEQSIEAWIEGSRMPSSRNLREIVMLLCDRYRIQAATALIAWHSLSLRSPQEMSGSVGTNARTLAEYIILPLWDDLRLAVDVLPYAEQEKVLEKAIKEAHDRTLHTAAKLT